MILKSKNQRNDQIRYYPNLQIGKLNWMNEQFIVGFYSFFGNNPIFFKNN